MTLEPPKNNLNLIKAANLAIIAAKFKAKKGNIAAGKKTKVSAGDGGKGELKQVGKGTPGIGNKCYFF